MILDYIRKIIQKEVVPPEFICYPLVALTGLPMFRIVEYYCNFLWPQIILISTPIIIVLGIFAYYKYSKNFRNLLVSSLFITSIIIFLLFMTWTELTNASSPPELFFWNYGKVLVIFYISWFVIGVINDIMKMHIDKL
jgi:hypothetical protein